MTLTIDARHDAEALTMTVVTELAATPTRAWQLWADPRQLERWWGPPTYPATFVSHHLVTGGSSRYYLTGPDGERMSGWWTISEADEPNGVTLLDGFADSDGNPDDSMPTIRMTLTLEPCDVGTRMTIVSTFASEEQMQQLLEMGMKEGITLAIGQIERILAQ